MGAKSQEPAERTLLEPQPPATRSGLEMSWVIPGKLAVGSSPQLGDRDRLASAQIQIILSLCANAEETLPDEVAQAFRCQRLVLPDSRYKSKIKVSQLAKAVEVVRDAVSVGSPIYVHCLAGVERSPTVCIAYLCKYEKLELWEAVALLKQVHPKSSPGESQLRVVQDYLAQEQS